MRITYERWTTDHCVEFWRFELHVHRQNWRTTTWAFGPKAGDGAWALATPWFVFYL